MSRGPCLDCDVIVVGAGAAGVSAARVLTSAGLRVQVLEARQRLGGRVWTEHVADNALDLGAAWIHGGDNPAHPMAQVCSVYAPRPRSGYQHGGGAGTGPFTPTPPPPALKVVREWEGVGVWPVATPPLWAPATIVHLRFLHPEYTPLPPEEDRFCQNAA